MDASGTDIPDVVELRCLSAIKNTGSENFGAPNCATRETIDD